MPATTRSANKQPKLEDVKGTVTKDKKANETRKRTAKDQDRQGAQSAEKPPAKKQKQSSPPIKPEAADDAEEEEEEEDVITINRAPVLELWSSCVSQFLYPKLGWSTCLSAGSAISTITAISKGRSIGTIAKPDPEEAAKRRENRQQKAETEELDEVEVMHFHLQLKKGEALISGKPKKANEDLLKKKFGGDEVFERVKRVMTEALASWKGKEENLSQEAFKMYEDFRPSVPAGQKGWGRKGQLNLQNVRVAIGGG